MYNKGSNGARNGNSSPFMIRIINTIFKAIFILLFFNPYHIVKSNKSKKSTTSFI